MTTTKAAMHPRPEPGRPPAEDVTDAAVTDLYAGGARRLVLPSMVDGALSVLAPPFGAARALRATSGGSRRCLDDHMAWFREPPAGAALTRLRLDLMARRCEAVRRAELRALSTCAWARSAGMLGCFAYQMAALGGVLTLALAGHDAASMALAPLALAPQLGAAVLAALGRLDAPRG